MRTPKKSINKNKYKSLSRKWSHMRSVSRAKALHTICDNSDLCMAIGKSYDKILNFFNNFHFVTILDPFGAVFDIVEDSDECRELRFDNGFSHELFEVDASDISVVNFYAFSLANFFPFFSFFCGREKANEKEAVFVF